jgi:hypothetical protein
MAASMNEGMLMSAENVVHLSPVWRERANFVIQADLAPVQLPGRREQLWAHQIGPYRFELCCIPFMTYGLALGDVVSTDETFVIRAVVESRGRKVLRIWFKQDGATLDLREEVLAEVRQHDLLAEWYSEHYLAIDSPDDAPLRGLVALLEGLSDDGAVYYEYGHAPPPVGQVSRRMMP